MPTTVCLFEKDMIDSTVDEILPVGYSLLGVEMPTQSAL